MNKLTEFFIETFLVIIAGVIILTPLFLFGGMI